MRRSLIFEQIGSACTRFKLEVEDMVFEINWHHVSKCWDVSGSKKGHAAGWDKIFLKSPSEPWQVNNFNDALTRVGRYLTHCENMSHYSFYVGANEYPAMKEEVKAFCAKKIVSYCEDKDKSVSEVPKKPCCECGKDTQGFTFHSTWCGLYPDNILE
jgi:hypothetical protein